MPGRNATQQVLFMFDSYTTRDVTYRGVACSCMGPSEIPGANGKDIFMTVCITLRILFLFFSFPRPAVSVLR